MNSIATEEETNRLLQKYNSRKISIFTCLQSSYPVMYKDTLGPLPKSMKDRKGYK